MSGMLSVEAVLRCKNWNYSDWGGMYHELPSMQTTLRVRDRTVIVTAHAETCCVEPAGLQDEIDAVVAAYSSGRSFVRASGTEDIVRIYAEAATHQECVALSMQVRRLVHQYADGMGDQPIS